MFQIHNWPNVILHLDGDAFFASVMQAIDPSLKGKPVVVGKERGIVTAISYEAKKFGIKRGMMIGEVKKLCPQCIVAYSDYETYSLFSQKMFSVLRSFTPDVEEYSVDEGFADLKGLQRPLNANYGKIGQMIKEKIEACLGLTVSVGISITKSLAKLASSANKPSGLTVVPGRSIEKLLAPIPLEKIWGIGPNTSAYLNKLGIKTALNFASQTEGFLKKHLAKPCLEIWHELRGEKVYELNFEGKKTYKSITKSQTFFPPTDDPEVLWARLLVHVEAAFAKARRFGYRVGKITIFLKTQEFRYQAVEIKLLETVAYPMLIREELKVGFARIFQKGTLYRATGCWLNDLKEDAPCQPTLFSDQGLAEEKVKKIYPLLEAKKVDFGTTLFDKKRLLFKSRPPKFRLPVLSLEP